MKSKRLISVILGTTLVLSTALVGCGNKNEASKSEAGKMDKDQYLNLVMNEEPKTLDITLGTDAVSGEVLAQITEGLTRCEQDKNGNDIVVPAGAEKWEHNEQGTEWTFHLRDNKWTDGKTVKAQDYVYGIKRTLDPKKASAYAYVLSPIKGADEYNSGKCSEAEVGVKAVDDKTIKFTLKQPCPYFLELTYDRVMLPQRQDLVEKYGEKYGTDAEKLACCGPFKVTKWEHNSEIAMEKNKDYWDNKTVKLQKATYKIIKDGNSATNSLYNGSVDVLEVLKPEWTKKLDATNKFNIVKGFYPDISFEFFNQKNKLFSNANIRKAFSIAINRDDMANVIYHGLYKPAYGWCPPKIRVGKEGEYRTAAGVGAAKKLIDENKDPKELLVKGLKELKMDPDPSKVTVTILHSGTTQTARTNAEYEQQMFQKALGIKIKAEYVEWPVFQKRINEYNYQMAGLIWGAGSDPSSLFDLFLTGANMIPTGWESKSYDEIVKKAKIDLDDKERVKLYKDAEKMLVHDEAVIAPKFYTRKNIYVYKYVKDFKNPLFGCQDLKHVYTEGRSK